MKCGNCDQNFRYIGGESDAKPSYNVPLGKVISEFGLEELNRTGAHDIPVTTSDINRPGLQPAVFEYFEPTGYN